MKNFLMALALVVSIPAFASDESEFFVDDEALSSEEELLGERRPVQPGRPEQPGRPGYPGDDDDDYDRPGRPGHGFPGWNHPRRRVECLATNLRGMRFVGRGMNRNQAARQALGICYRYGSYQCEVHQCRVVFGR